MSDDDLALDAAYARLAAEQDDEDRAFLAALRRRAALWYAEEERDCGNCETPCRGCTEAYDD